MRSSILRDRLLLCALCASVGTLAWIFYVAAFYREPSQDWMVFYTAARAYWEHDLPLIFDGDRLTAAINERFSSWLSWPLPLHPWLYPPHYLLFLLPFGLIPPALACVLFLLVGLALAVGATWTVARDASGRCIHAVSLTLCPAAAINICLGQNAFLTSALLIAGISLARQRQLLGGVMLGMLSFKPQLWILVPVALIAARQWWALTSTFFAALFVALVSLLLFGPEVWHIWLNLMTRPSVAYESWLAVGRLNGQSVYACIALLGAPRIVANFVQGLVMLLAGSCVFWIFRRPIAFELRLSVLLSATVVAAPHLILYDAVMLAVAATFLFCHGCAQRLRFGETLIMILVWLSPLANSPRVSWLGFLTPIVIMGFIVCIILRGMGDSQTTRSSADLATATG